MSHPESSSLFTLLLFIHLLFKEEEVTGEEGRWPDGIVPRDSVSEAGTCSDTLGHLLPRHEGPGFKPTQAQGNPTAVWPPAALP